MSVTTLPCYAAHQRFLLLVKMMKLRLAFISTLLLPLSMQAATISITSTCQGPGLTPITVSGNCSEGSPLPGVLAGASVTASASFSVAASLSSYSVFSTQSSVNANGSDPYPPSTAWVPALAQSLVSFSDTLITAGTPRAGYIQLTVSGSAGVSPGYEMGSGVLTLVNPGDGSSLGTICAYGYPIGCPSPSYNSQNTFPFELGVVFPIQYAANVLANSRTSDDGPSNEIIQLTYGLRFLEADGVTPVVVSETPEPSTSVLLAPALIWLAAIRHQRKKRKQPLSTRVH